MKDWRSQSHVKWEFLYHVTIVPEYRRKVCFAERRRQIAKIGGCALQSVGREHNSRGTGTWADGFLR